MQFRQPPVARLARDWSPEQVAGRLEQEHPDEPELRVSAQTIYRWIEQDADRVHARLKERLKELDEERRRTIAFDNGTEERALPSTGKAPGRAAILRGPWLPVESVGRMRTPTV